MKLIVHPEEVNVPKAALCRDVVRHLGADYVPTHLILDADVYAGNHAVLNEFRDIAFCWTRDRRIDKVPPYLLEVMRDPDCTHLVWLSRKALAYQDQLFVWVLAHELRHLYQSRREFPRDCIRTKVRELRRNHSYVTLPASVFAPEEIDCDLCALRTVNSVFGKDDMRSFLSSTLLPRCPFPEYPRLLQETLSACPT
jgi:hypothetical protein